MDLYRILGTSLVFRSFVHARMEFFPERRDSRSIYSDVTQNMQGTGSRGGDVVLDARKDSVAQSWLDPMSTLVHKNFQIGDMTF